MSSLRIAIVQMEIVPGDRRANYEKVEKTLDSKWIGSDIPTAVILPEIWDVGYVIEDSDKFGDRDASQAAEFLGKLAVRHECWFTGGSVLALTEKGAANRAMVIDPSGNYRTYYDKIHLIPLSNVSTLTDVDSTVTRGWESDSQKISRPSGRQRGPSTVASQRQPGLAADSAT